MCVYAYLGRSLFQRIISELGVNIANSFSGWALIAFSKRALPLLFKPGYFNYGEFVFFIPLPQCLILLMLNTRIDSEKYHFFSLIIGFSLLNALLKLSYKWHA